MEDELRDPSNFLEYMLPRSVRLVLLWGAAASCLVAALLGVGRLLQDPLALSDAPGSTQDITNLAINAAGAAGFAALASADSARGGAARVAQRKRLRQAQIKAGIREVYVNQEGERMSRLRELDDGLIMARLESWGARDNMPFIGPQKAAILGGLVADKAPRMAVEVGAMAGYSAIAIARALPADGRLVSYERDVWWWAAAARCAWQARSGESGAGNKIDVRLGDAIPALAQWPASALRIDLLFLDGVPKDSLAYLQAAEPHLAPGALVVADNAGVFGQGGMRGYLEYVRGSPRYSSRSVACTLEWRPDVPDAIEVSTFLS